MRQYTQTALTSFPPEVPIPSDISNSVRELLRLRIKRSDIQAYMLIDSITFERVVRECQAQPQ